MYAPSAPEGRLELRERARRLRWVLVGAAGVAFAAAAGLVMTNPIGTQAQAASAPPPAQDQPPAPQYQGPRYQGGQQSNPPVGYAPQPQPILRTRRS